MKKQNLIAIVASIGWLKGRKKYDIYIDHLTGYTTEELVIKYGYPFGQIHGIIERYEEGFSRVLIDSYKDYECLKLERERNEELYSKMVQMHDRLKEFEEYNNSEVKEEFEGIDKYPVEGLSCNPRVKKVFEHLGIKYLTDLRKFRASDLLKVPNCGVGTFKTIREELREKGLDYL